MITLGTFEISVLASLMFLDVVIGYIRALFFEHDFNVKRSINGILKKLVIFIVCGGIDLIIIFSKLAKPINIQLIDFISILFDGIILLSCYSEAVSVLAQLTLITGVDFSSIPGVKNSVLNRKDK